MKVYLCIIIHIPVVDNNVRNKHNSQTLSKYQVVCRIQIYFFTKEFSSLE